MLRCLVLFTLLASAGAAVAQPLPVGLDPMSTLLLDTRHGRIVIKLREDVAPQHAARLKTLAREKFYDSAPFHRVIPNFMAQTGDGERGDGTGKSKYPDLPAEFSHVPFVRGVVGMARSSHSVHSANSQFFIMLGSAPHLNQRYTVVGEVVAGMEAVDKIKKGDPRINDGAVVVPDRILRARVAGDVK